MSFEDSLILVCIVVSVYFQTTNIISGAPRNNEILILRQKILSGLRKSCCLSHECFLRHDYLCFGRRQWHPTPVLLPRKSHGRRSLVKAAVHGVAKSQTRLSDFTFTFHFHALEKEMATHSSILAWRIPRMGESGGLPSMGLHRVGHDGHDLAAAASILWTQLFLVIQTTCNEP